MPDFKYRPLPPLEELRDKFIYDPVTGLLRWRHGSGGTRAGDIAGTVNPCGHVVVGGSNDKLMAHRMIWVMIHGVEPSGDIDHIDGNGSNNRPENLRDVPRAVNVQNSKLARLNNKAGFLGVSRQKGTKNWKAQITIKGKVTYLGLFSTPEKAHEAYLQAKREFHQGNTL